MLSPEYLAQLPEPVVKLWQQVEDDILKDIARRIAKMDGLTDTAAYQVFRLEQTRLLRQDIVKLLAKYSGKSETSIRRMMQEAATETLRSEDAIHTAAGKVLTPPNESKNLLNILNSGYLQTSNTWKNLTATTANTVTKQFENALDRAWLQVSSGAFSHQDAVKRAIDDLAQHMDGVTYPTGHHDTLEVAVRRAVLTGVNQTCAKLQWERIVESGCKFIEVTAHEGAREDEDGGPADHAGWQGRVYHIGGAIDHEGKHYEDFHTATGYGTGPGLCGWNCRHNFHAFYPGISVPAYSEELLASYKARNIEYNGKMYTRYEINQMQRSLERKVRKSKQQWMAEREAGQDSTAAAFKLKANRKKLSDFVKATGGKQYSYRTATWDTSTLPGKKFGRSEASKANWDVRHAEMKGSEMAAKKSFTSQTERGTMKAINGARITNTYSPAARAHADRYYGLVREMKTDAARIAQNTGYSEEAIQRIKDFIFIEKHDLGDSEPRRFDPSFAMAQSWQRLINGTPEPHDLTLLKHEMLERELMEAGMSQHDAHIETSKKYNYTKESDDYYAALKERKNRK